MKASHILLCLTIGLGVGCCAKLILSTYSTKTVTKTTTKAHTNVIRGDIKRLP